jgi:EAL domain-containing protein (putative c-di-GMP-specific phosphodiesterase class I)/GGDEF domain-containing protein/PAS domain-containing protein
MNILIIGNSHDDANRFSSILRSVDYQVDAKLVSNEEELQKYLSMRNWDLLLAPINYSTLPIQNIFQRIRRSERDIPVILINNEYDPAKLIEGLRLGAQDVVIEDQHFLKVVERSLAEVYERRKCREWERKLSLAEKRAQHLMDTSRFPIAVVQEGTYVYANEACAAVFGFDQPDEMLCLPIIDNIAASDREKINAYMVPLEAQHEIIPFEAVVKTLDTEGTEFNSFLEINQIQYEGEPALQFTINKDKLFDAHIEKNEEFSITEYSVIQPQLVYELISRAISNSVQTGQDSILLNFQMDRFDQLKDDLGIAKAEKIAHSLVAYVVDFFFHNVDCGRLTENSFIVTLVETNEEEALGIATDIAQKISQELFDIDNEILSLTVAIGGILLNENVPSIEGALARSQEVLDELRDERGVGNGAKFYMPNIHSNEVSKNEAVIITAKHQLSDELFSIRYQPIVALTGGGSGKEYYEVILGVKKSVANSEIPANFINDLFKSDIAVKVDRWVIKKALTSLSKKLSVSPQTQLFINISTQSFSDGAFLSWLREVFKKINLPANAVIFQFREIDAMRYLKKAAAISDQIKKVDGQISIANFGLAINPLKILERVAVDFVKIDPLMVEKLSRSGDGKAEFQKLMGGMMGTGVNVIVPFVEKASILPFLWQQSVQYIQGHYINKPSFDMDYDFTEGS